MGGVQRQPDLSSYKNKAMSKKYKLLFIGTDNPGGNDVSFYTHLSEHYKIESTILLKQNYFLNDKRLYQKLIKKILSYTNFYYNMALQEELLKLVYQYKPDIIFCFKTVELSEETIIRIKKDFPSIIFAHFHPDSVFNKKNYTPFFIEAIRHYDIHFVPKRNNIPFYLQHGCDNIYFTPYGADPYFHFPVPLDEGEKSKWISDISFIGYYERFREEHLIEIINNTIYKVRVWGPSWVKCKVNHDRLEKNLYLIHERELSKAIYNSKINLAFLRKSNYDLITARSFEIPGAGGFMLHERTNEIEEFFTEGVNADFFSSPEECIDKINFYLNNDHLREKIALKGYKLVSQFHTYPLRAAAIINAFDEYFLNKKHEN